MIKKLNIKNIKCFTDLSLELEKLNVLTGLNSAGKSTVIQSLLLLRQAYDMNSISSGLHLNGDLVTIGTGYDLLNRDSGEDIIEIKIECEPESYCWKYAYNKNSDYQRLCESNVEGKSFKNINLFKPTFAYISAERLGPRRFYQQSYHKVMEKNDVGRSGEFFADYLVERGLKDKVTNPYILNFFKSKTSELLIYQMQAWLSEVSPGIRLDVEKYNDAGIVNMKYGVSTETFSPINVGFGISYVAPIVLSLLKAQKDDLIILENPEAHLHPKGQRKMGELISLAARGGAQIIIETHSDHILNGIRLSVKNNIISKDDVRLNYFFQEKQDGKRVIHKKLSPAILANGRLSSWPEGFFDEWDKAIAELL